MQCSAVPWGSASLGLSALGGAVTLPPPWPAERRRVGAARPLLAYAVAPNGRGAAREAQNCPSVRCLPGAPAGASMRCARSLGTKASRDSEPTKRAIRRDACRRSVRRAPTSGGRMRTRPCGASPEAERVAWKGASARLLARGHPVDARGQEGDGAGADGAGDSRKATARAVGIPWGTFRLWFPSGEGGSSAPLDLHVGERSSEINSEIGIRSAPVPTPAPAAVAESAAAEVAAAREPAPIPPPATLPAPASLGIPAALPAPTAERVAPRLEQQRLAQGSGTGPRAGQYPKGGGGGEPGGQNWPP